MNLLFSNKVVKSNGLMNLFHECVPAGTILQIYSAATIPRA